MVRPLSHKSAKQIKSISITEEGWQGLNTLAKALGTSRSELCNRLGQSSEKILKDEDSKKFLSSL